jgi:hypothetical protein
MRCWPAGRPGHLLANERCWPRLQAASMRCWLLRRQADRGMRVSAGAGRRLASHAEGRAGVAPTAIRAVGRAWLEPAAVGLRGARPMRVVPRLQAIGRLWPAAAVREIAAGAT